MSNRFVDNVTPLNAETLNQFEEDMKQLSSLPIYNATHDSSSTSSFYNYKISDLNFESALRIGYTFIMIPDVSSQGTDDRIMAISHGGYGDPLYWNDMNVTPTIGYGYARVNQEKYLVAGRPYIIKCFAKLHNNYQFIITEMPQFTLPAASQTILGGVKIWVNGTTLYISTE